MCRHTLFVIQCSFLNAEFLIVFHLDQSSAEEVMLAILSKIKAERAVMKHELLQSHCRVYVGLCRWRGDCQKAHALAYSVLKEGEDLLTFSLISNLQVNLKYEQ